MGDYHTFRCCEMVWSASGENRTRIVYLVDIKHNQSCNGTGIDVDFLADD